MKIEKINDNQIKFILNQTDLRQRNIQLTELTYGSQKARDLFQEMMEQAREEYGFEVENSPLMIEAVPVNMECIMIMVTKISSLEEYTDKFASQALDELEKLNYEPRISPPEWPKVPRQKKSGYFCAYAFKSLEEIISVVGRLDFYTGKSSIYKKDDQYVLLLEGRGTQEVSLPSILGEYGSKISIVPGYKYHLMEHAEPIIKVNAVKKLSLI